MEIIRTYFLTKKHANFVFQKQENKINKNLKLTAGSYPSSISRRGWRKCKIVAGMSQWRDISQTGGRNGSMRRKRRGILGYIFTTCHLIRTIVLWVKRKNGCWVEMWSRDLDMLNVRTGPSRCIYIPKQAMMNI